MPDLNNPTLGDLETMAGGSAPAPAPGSSLDDDYHSALVGRENQRDLDWFNEQAGQLGVEGVNDEKPKAPEQPAQAEAGATQPGTAEGDGGYWDRAMHDFNQHWEGAKTFAKDLYGIPRNAGHIGIGGAERGVNSMIDLANEAGAWGLLSKKAYEQYQALPQEQKDAIGIPKIPNWGELQDRPDDSVSAAMAQGIVQFLTGFGVVGKAAPGLKLAKELPGTLAGAAKESAKLWTRAEITEFAAFDGQEGNLANLVETVPALKNPVTDFLATNEETPEITGRLKNALANAPFNLPLDVFVGHLRAVREARKVKALTGAETYEEAAKKLAEGGVDPAEALAQPSGSKIEALLGREDDDIIKFVDPYVQQTGDQDMVRRLSQAIAQGGDEAPLFAAGGTIEDAAKPTLWQSAVNAVKQFVPAFRDATPAQGADGPLFAAGGQTAAQDSLGYYSGLEKAVRSLKQDKGTPEQMLAMISKEGGKKAEIEATNLGEFLKDKKSVTKSEIISYLEENGVGVRETSRDAGARARNEARSAQLRDQIEAGIRAFYPHNNASIDQMVWSLRQNLPLTPSHEGALQAVRDASPEFDALIRESDELRRDPNAGGPKWSSYSLDPNNPTYREIVLHLPATGAAKSFDAWKATLPSWERFADDASLRAEFARVQPKEDFRSGHFSEPNIVGHMMTSTVKHEGKKTFLLDQIQSDWGQRIRERGARDENKIAELEARVAAVRNGEGLESRLEAIVKDPTHKDRFLAEDVLKTMRENAWTPERLVAQAREFDGARAADDLKNLINGANNAEVARLEAELITAKADVAGHPLVNTTDQWVNTTLRRAIRQAVEDGADHIAIPSGKTVLSYNPGDTHGMEGFYNDIVPKNLKNLLRKLDKDSPEGSKVAKLETPTQGPKGEGFTVFPLTQKVKDAVMAEGQPLFAAGGKSAEKKYLETVKARQNALRDGVELIPHESLAPEVFQAYKDRAHRFPDGTAFGHVASVVKDGDSGAVRLNYIDANGQAGSVTLKGADVLGSRAVYIPARDTILSLRFDAFGGFGKAVAGEINHEIVHVLRRKGLIPGADWSRLVGFAHRLGILDVELNSYLNAIRDPAAAETALYQSKSLYQIYKHDTYAGRANLQELLDQEAVTHLMEFVHHGLISEKKLAPVADLIQKLRDGSYTGKTAEPSIGPRSDNPNLAWDEPLFAAGADTVEQGAEQAARPRGKMYVNWARINSPDDVKNAMQTMADQFSHEIDLTRRGVRTNAQTMQAAGDENAWKLLIGERQGNLPRAEEQLALRQLWAASGEKLMELSKLAASGGDEELFAFRRMLAVHNTIQQQVIGIRTETARALQQWKIPAGGDKEKLKQLKFAIDANGGSDVTKALAERIAILADRPGWQGAVDQMVKKGAFAKSMDAVREAWINAILSGPKTHIVNMMSNGSVIAQSMLERAIASRIGDILDPVDGVRIGEATAMWWGVKESARDAIRYAGQSLRTGESGFGRGQIEGPRTRAISSEAAGVDGGSALGKGLDMLGGVVTIPGRFLQAEDEFFKTINYRAELHAQAFRQASEEIDRGALAPDGLKSRMADLVANPPENLRLKAADMAAYNTFQQEPGEISKKLIGARNALDQTVGFPLGTMIMPFINTPGNIMKYTFERTPLAGLSAKVRADLAAGGARRDLALARIGLGTMLIGTAYDLALNGHITGSGPGDKQTGERQALRRSGWQPYSIRVRVGGTDDKPEYRWYAYNRLDPIGSLFGMSSELAEVMRNSDSRQNVELGEAISGLVLGASQTYMNKSYLTGVSGLIEAMHDPDRYAESWWNKTMSSVVPAVVAEAARFNDPVMRHNYDVLSSIKRRTPGLSSDLPPRLNFWGEPITYQSGLGSLYDMVSPIYSNSNAKAKDIDREFFNIDYFPTHPGSIRIDGKAISLRNDPEVMNRIITLTGVTKASTLVDDNFDDMAGKKGGGKAALNRLMNFGDQTLPEALTEIIKGRDATYGLEYLEADADGKKDILGDVIRAYRSAAQAQVLREYPELSKRRAELPTREEMAQDAPF